MPQGTPTSGEKYRHFKDKLYQVVTIASHSETGEQLVIYQALYGDFGVYARPLAMFISQVDHVKYPDVKQKFRFELVETLQTEKQSGEGEKSPLPEKQSGEGEKSPVSEAGVEAEPLREAVEKENQLPQRKTMEDLLMDFYDARTYEDKYQILLDMEEGITDVMINNMAVVLDLVIPEGPMDQRYQELKHCLRTRKQYEKSRI